MKSTSVVVIFNFMLNFCACDRSMTVFKQNKKIKQCGLQKKIPEAIFCANIIAKPFFDIEFGEITEFIFSPKNYVKI